MDTFRTFPQSIFPTLHRIVRQLPLLITALLLLAALVNLIGTALGWLPAWAAVLLDALSNLSTVFLGIFIEAVPFLLLGTLASGIVEVFLDSDDLARWVPRRPLPAVLAGSMIGLFFPVCECGVVPFTRRLMRKGVPAPVGIATLLAAPVINPIVIASTLAAFGSGPVFWGRIGLTLLIAVLTGLIFSRSSMSGSLLRQEALPVNLTAEPPTTNSLVEKKPALFDRLRQVMLIAVDEFFEMGRYLILGALLAAMMQTFISQSALLQVGQGPVLSVIVLVALAVLLSICSTVDAFIALAFTGSFTGGAVLAFLVFGPMVDIKSTFMFLQVFKPRAVLYLILLPLMFTLVSTVFLNFVGKGWLF